MSAGYQIAIKFSGTESDTPLGSGKGSSSDFLNQVLTKLTAAVDKLTNTLNKQMFLSNSGIGGGGSGGGPSGSTTDSSGKTDVQKLSSILTTSAIAAIAVTTVRWMSANATALMAQASNRGAFVGAGISGQANQAFPSYIGNFYDIEKARLIARNNAIGQGAGAAVGGAIGFATGGIAGAAAGATTGVGLSEYATAREANANIAQAYPEIKALEERRAAASISEWQTGFARFGLAKTPYEVASSSISGTNPIDVSLSKAFEAKYGTVNGAFNPNYNAILNNIAPYLQSSPLDNKNGDLNKVAQNFQEAGFAVSQFSQLTMQASQYQALTGRNLQQFSEDLKAARSKFGNAYTAESNQTALNLMAMGYNSTEAQNVAFQSQYNSGILNSASQFTSMSPSSYYSALALSKPLGFDLFNTIKKGQFQGSAKKRADLLRQIQTAENGGGLSNDLMILQSQGYNLAEVSQWLQPAVSPLKGAVNPKTTSSDAQTIAMKELTDGIKNALNNVGDMVVNATNVTINNANPGTLQSNVQSTVMASSKLSFWHATKEWFESGPGFALGSLSGQRPLSKQ